MNNNWHQTTQWFNSVSDWADLMQETTILIFALIVFGYFCIIFLYKKATKQAKHKYKRTL